MNEAATLYWINFQGNLVYYYTLGTGQEVRMNTYVTHPWVIRDGSSRTVVVFLPRRTASRAVIYPRIG
ncbi:von Hippel-Lindau disease tumor suppressor, beta/alpha domain-containing protein [Rhodocollybia butyracea]|uniref:von Hippel-Lindau disease tumor suppressor, beta/alpha domain-containing protein n=1 Tax=Rhodocollybia butyracea TaxID=206335 RepID=A0A9P5TWM5_9AGAR|nr:von Hippel-Lindau disease tumor suppressor, beta/alpha domain-containing protein [Rhodocollybia butyracea]